jgi:Tol biopolymer transport system component
MGDKANRFEVDWSPSGSMVAQFNKGSGSLTSSIFFVGQHGENFRKINMNGYGVETEWTPDGSRIVYSAHNFNSEHKPLLHVVNASGETIGYDHQSLKLNTWPDKCAFADKDTMYCGVPKELPYAADYAPEIADDIPDYIYKVNLKTGVKSFVAEPEYSYTIETMQVSEDGEVLYFTDKLTKSLHTINLK